MKMSFRLNKETALKGFICAATLFLCLAVGAEGTNVTEQAASGVVATVASPAPAFCQAFAKLLVAGGAEDDLEERIGEELRGFEIGYPRGVIEYEDDGRLAPLVDAIYAKMKGTKK